MNQVWLAGGIFLVIYGLIVTERVHRTIAALLGGVAVILAGILPQHDAFGAIDWNVIFLLTGMMVIANLLRETGVFQWIAVQAVRLGKGNPYRILVILSLITAFTSALLDNVTIVVLVAPVTLFVATSLRVSPAPFLLAEIFASNIGGTATLIGDPPNILIGSAAGIDFLTFVANMGPVTLLIMAAFVGLTWWLFRPQLAQVSPKPAPATAETAGAPAVRPLAELNAMIASELIGDRPLLVKGAIVLAGVLVGFVLQGALHLEPATVALTGATVLMLWGKADPHRALRDVEWSTLLFFVGLFMLVEAVVKVGIIEQVAGGVMQITRGDVRLASITLLWFSAVMSAIVDNIPYTATMIPVVQTLATSMPSEPLWWSLALGACLGGNATLVGASANIVVASLADRAGHPITFGQFLRYGFPVTVMSLGLATAYVVLRYL